MLGVSKVIDLNDQDKSGTWEKVDVTTQIGSCEPDADLDKLLCNQDSSSIPRCLIINDWQTYWTKPVRDSKLNMVWH